jgi:predicted nucleic acid-binding protein
MNRLRSVGAKARKTARDAGDENDWEYVALSWVEDAPIWTYDADFSRMDGVRTISTAEVSGET